MSVPEREKNRQKDLGWSSVRNAWNILFSFYCIKHISSFIIGNAIENIVRLYLQLFESHAIFVSSSQKIYLKTLQTTEKICKHVEVPKNESDALAFS